MSTIEEIRDDEVIELEPTIQLDLAGPWSAHAAAPRPEAGVALVEGGLASFSGETESLRRRRLAAAAFVLTLTYAALFFWDLTASAWNMPVAWVLMGLRFGVAATVLGLVISPVGRVAWRVTALEALLFGGLMVLLCTAQYFVGLGLVRRGDLMEVVARGKNGVIQTVLAMMIFGTFIPHRPKTVAWVVLAMALTPLLGIAILTEHPEVAALTSGFRSSLVTGDAAVYLLLGAGIAIVGSLVVNGLRTELHEAQKFGQYRLVRKLGAGGMGEVYLAEHSLLKRPCALKLIKAESGADPLALARFEREVQSSAQLAHHNTIAIYDYGHTDDGTFFYVMEYLKGMSLAEMIERYGPLSAGRVIYLFRQVCSGLAEAHALGLVHRDLKPANIFIARVGGESDVAKVLDFGLVKLMQEPGAAALTAEMTVSGTPLYMPPEQAAADRTLDARADIYALGAVMYHALTGRPPFVGNNPMAIMIALSRDAVVPPSEVLPGIPPDLEAVVLRCLSKNPTDRFPTITALNQALAECASAADWGPRRADAWWESISDESRPEQALIGTPEAAAC